MSPWKSEQLHSGEYGGGHSTDSEFLMPEYFRGFQVAIPSPEAPTRWCDRGNLFLELPGVPEERSDVRPTDGPLPPPGALLHEQVQAQGGPADAGHGVHAVRLHSQIADHHQESFEEGHLGRQKSVLTDSPQTEFQLGTATGTCNDRARLQGSLAEISSPFLSVNPYPKKITS